MNKNQAYEIFTEVQKYYNSVKYPKYRNISLEEFKEKYDSIPPAAPAKPVLPI